MATHREHTSPIRTYLLVFAALLLLAGTTVAVAYVPLGHWHTAIALLIAIAKATLIVLFFMHALESSRLVWIVIAGAILWLGIMLGGTLSDYLTRDVDRDIRKQTSQCVSFPRRQC
jgi:cytochrome c oxidase subunit 4